MHKKYIKNKRPEAAYYSLQNLLSEISSYSSKYKNDYCMRLGKRLGDLARSIKSYWATLRTLWNGKKVTNISTLLVNNKPTTEFDAKANIFNKYFASQCTTIDNNSILRSTLNHLTDEKLCSFNIFSEVVFQLIKNLDLKYDEHDEISVKMIKLTLVFENCLASERFSNIWKKRNIVEAHKKGITN